MGSLATQGHLRLVGVTDDSKLGSLVPTGFFEGNTFRVKNGAYSPALGGDTGFGGWDKGTCLGTTLMRFGDSSLGFGGWDKGTWGLGVGDNLDEIWGQLFRFWGLGQGDLGFRGGTCLGTTLMRFGDSSLGFGGWDKGTWGLGVGDNLDEIWGQLFRFWGLGQGDLGFRGGTCLGTTLMRFGDSSLGFGGWDKGTWGLGVGDNLDEIWGQLFRFWGLGQGDLGFRGGTCLGTTLMRFGDSSLGFGGWDKGTWGLGVGDNLDEIWGQLFRFWGLGQGDLGFRGGTCLGTTLMRFGDSSLGFGGWDKGTWGLGVGDNLDEIWGQLFRFWGLGQGDLGFRGGTCLGTTLMRFGDSSLGFGGWDKGTWGLGVGDNLDEIWGQLFRFWGLGQGDLGFRGGTCLGTTLMRFGDSSLGFGGWDKGTWGLGVGDNLDEIWG